MAHFMVRQASPQSTENKNNAVFSVGAVFLVISTAGMAARLASKKMKRTPFFVDDVLVIWAYILCVGETGMIIWATKYAGFGHHLASLSKQQVVSFEKVLYSVSLIQPCLLASTKLSILILLYRIFITKAFRTTALVLMAIVACWWISISFAVAFICSPVDSQWNPDLPGYCGNQYLLNIIDPIPWILTDFAILFAPMPMVWKLQMPARQKAALAGLFLIGGLTCIVSCVPYRYAFFSLTDPTWDSVSLANWQLVEAHVTIFCACLIASKPVFMFLIPDTMFSKMGSFFSRSFRTLSDKNKISHQEAQHGGHFGSRAYLPDHGASIEFQRKPDSFHTEGTKISQEATHVISNDSSQSPSRPQYTPASV